MAALVERLMGEPYSAPAEKIPVHEFFAGQMEVMQGYLTTAQVKNYYLMDSAAITDYDALVALCPPAAQTANRAVYIERVHAVFLLAEHRTTGYDTPAAVRAKLGI